MIIERIDPTRLKRAPRLFRKIDLVRELQVFDIITSSHFIITFNRIRQKAIDFSLKA